MLYFICEACDRKINLVAQNVDFIEPETPMIHCPDCKEDYTIEIHPRTTILGRGISPLKKNLDRWLAKLPHVTVTC